MRSLSFRVLVLPAISLCLTLSRGSVTEKTSNYGAQRSNLRRNLIPDMRKGSLGTRMAAFLPVNPATT